MWLRKIACAVLVFIVHGIVIAMIVACLHFTKDMPYLRDNFCADHAAPDVFRRGGVTVREHAGIGFEYNLNCVSIIQLH